MAEHQPDDEHQPGDGPLHDPGSGERSAATSVDATFVIGPVTRVAHALTLVVLTVMTVAMLTGGNLNWFVVVFVVLVAIQAMNTALMWRWRLTTDQGGVTVRQGFSPPRHVAWEAIVSIHGRLPPVIEVQGADDVSLGTGISRRTLARAAEHLRAQAAAHGPGAG